MLEKYCSERALDKIEDEFREMKKGNNPVSYYAKQFLEKLGLVEHLAPDEKAKIKAYVRGLPAEMKSAVRIAKVTTLHEAIEESMRLEDDITEIRGEHHQAGQKRKKEEPLVPTRQTRTTEVGRREEPRHEPRWCHECRSKHHGPCRPRPHVSQVGCHKCGEKDHSARDCSMKETVCYECKEPGHFKRECPQLMRARAGASIGSIARGENPSRAPSRAFQMIVEEPRETTNVASGKFFAISALEPIKLIQVSIADYWVDHVSLVIHFACQYLV